MSLKKEKANHAYVNLNPATLRPCAPSLNQSSALCVLSLASRPLLLRLPQALGLVLLVRNFWECPNIYPKESVSLGSKPKAKFRGLANT